jgi:hypothetical protein
MLRVTVTTLRGNGNSFFVDIDARAEPTPNGPLA